MSLIHGFRNKAEVVAEATAEEIKNLSDGVTGQTKVNKESIAVANGRVNKLNLKFFSLKNNQYTTNAKAETNKNDITALSTGQVNNKAEIDTLGAGVSNLSNGTSGQPKTNKDAIAVNTAEITKLKKVSTAGLSSKITALETKVGPAEIVKATGDFYVGNTQGTFKIENLNIPPDHSLISVKFKAKPGLSGLFEATMYSGVDVADVNYNYPITDGVGLNAIKSGKTIGLKRNRTHDVWNTNYFVRTFGDARGTTPEKFIDVEILYFKIP